MTSPTGASEPDTGTWALPIPLRRRLVVYRVIAWVVGVFLIVLMLVGMPLKYGWDQGVVVAVVGPLHGFLYMIYLAVTAELGLRARWAWRRLVLVLLAGTVPFLSFVAERAVARGMREGDWVGAAQ